MRGPGNAAVLCSLLFAPAVWGEDATYTYRMRGEVRLLLFWMGRDGVGGGKISLRRGGGEARWWEEVEVVFGSEPARVPGHVNRWGYARERAEWEMAGEKPALVRTVFDGLMRHTDSKTSAGVLRDNRGETARGLYQYKALHGEAARGGATAEIRIFHDPREFHYRAPESLVARYNAGIASQPAMESRRLAPTRYGDPAGFLTGLRALVGRVLDGEERPSAMVLHNATVYRVEVKNAAPGAVRAIRFGCMNMERKTRTEFSLEAPAEGPLRGIPVRIEYQPNWWLRVRLDMEPPVGAARR